MASTGIQRALGVAATAVFLSAAAGTAAASASQPEIVGGEEAAIEDYPWTVAILKNGEPWCGASMAAGTKLISAAHCFSGAENATYTAVAGTADVTADDATEVEVTDIWLHPRFDRPDTGDDLAVLTVGEELDGEPVRIADSEDLYEEGTEATVLGWGNTEEGGDGSDRLMKVEVPVTSSQACQQAYGTGYLEEAMVCAGYEEGGKDACQGDSGGPLVVDGTLVGIVSWGYGCARPGLPGVYTRVISYADMINDQLSR